MNSDRRSRVARIRNELEKLLEEEEAAFDRLPEAVQESARGERMQEVIDFLSEAIEALEELLNV